MRLQHCAHTKTKTNATWRVGTKLAIEAECQECPRIFRHYEGSTESRMSGRK